MLKLSAVMHARKLAIDRAMEHFLCRHPYGGIFLCCVVMPSLLLLAVGAACCTLALPISVFMGWL